MKLLSGLRGKRYGVLATLAAAALLTACATSTPYQPRAEGTSGYGYQEQRIEPNRFSLSFRGNSITDRDQVENYLLYRAAELTIQNGFDYFIVANRDTEVKSELRSTGPTRSPFFFSQRYYSPRYGWAPWYDPFWDDPISYREITRYEATAEVLMAKGKKPADRADAFDARDVEANLRGKIVRPAGG